MNPFSRIQIETGDITQSDCDAIVNAANTSLLGGGGVDGAIHKAAGPELLAYCKTLGGCKTGEAKSSPGYNLKARHVIHTVGPVWKGGGSNENFLLESCYRNSLLAAKELSVKSIAFPGISTGAYGFPMEAAASIALKSTLRTLFFNEIPQKVVFFCFDDKAREIYDITLDKLKAIQRSVFSIHGKVQGVFFRKFTQEKAHQLNLSGYVMNQKDGSVFCEAEGAEPDLEKFYEWLHTGSPGSNVDHVTIDREDPVFYNGFEIRFLSR